jgi:hypothetical protein
MKISDKLLSRVNISKNDFEMCVNFLNETANVNIGSYSYEALWMMAIVAYCRPFSHNEKSGNNKAAAKIDAPQMTTKERELHATLIKCRNKIVAHSEIKFNPTSTDSDTGIIWRKRASIWSFLQGFNLSKNLVIALANKMLNYCHNESADLINKHKRPNRQWSASNASPNS